MNLSTPTMMFINMTNITTTDTTQELCFIEMDINGLTTAASIVESTTTGKHSADSTIGYVAEIAIDSVTRVVSALTTANRMQAKKRRPVCVKEELPIKRTT